MAMKTASSRSKSNGERTSPGSPNKTESTKRSQIVRGNLHDEVVTVLRDMIIQDELQPGTRIPESALCTQLGISRTPLREALRVLAEHEQIAALVQRRDGRKLSELLLQHMLGSWRDFEVTLDRPKLARSYWSR